MGREKLDRVELWRAAGGGSLPEAVSHLLMGSQLAIEAFVRADTVLSKALGLGLGKAGGGLWTQGAFCCRAMRFSSSWAGVIHPRLSENDRMRARPLWKRLIIATTGIHAKQITSAMMTRVSVMLPCHSPAAMLDWYFDLMSLRKNLRMPKGPRFLESAGNQDCLLPVTGRSPACEAFEACHGIIILRNPAPARKQTLCGPRDPASPQQYTLAFGRAELPTEKFVN